jgi:hypothetical protein
LIATFPLWWVFCDSPIYTRRNIDLQQINKEMSFSASFCDPLKSDVIELGSINTSSIIETFRRVPWSDYLEKMENARECDIHYSPTLEIENNDNKHGLSISAIGEKDNVAFFIFYKRPKHVRKYFGLIQKFDNHYSTEISGQTSATVIECLQALIDNQLDFLDNKIK